jgi:hypothetical protein
MHKPREEKKIRFLPIGDRKKKGAPFVSACS